LPASSLHNLKRAARALVWAALFIFAAWAYPAEAKYNCAPLKDAIPEILKNHAILAFAELQNGAAIIMFVNKSSSFIIIGVDEKEMSCVLMRGDGLRFAVEREL